MKSFYRIHWRWLSEPGDHFYNDHTSTSPEMARVKHHRRFTEDVEVISVVHVTDAGVQKSQEITLSPADAVVVAELLENPPEPNAVLKDAVKIHAEMTGPGPDERGPQGVEGLPGGE